MYVASRATKKGTVGTYENQALVLVNFGGATAKEIALLAREMTAAVNTATAISIEPEVHYVGNFA
jgi:UDP-N-acetylmuramate dehydrogenase